ncbi:MAG: 2'-5' RNA ligase family protein [Armatimonadota bacterium]
MDASNSTSAIVGVMSILKGPARAEALRMWTLFESKYKSAGIHVFPYPNVSFQGGECVDLSALDDALLRISNTVKPFRLTIEGISVFETTGVLYMAVNPTPKLLEIHRQIDDLLTRSCIYTFDFYMQDRWTPHVTLGMNMTDVELHRASQDLYDYHPYYHETIEELQLVRVQDDQQHIDIVANYQLTGNS